LILLDTNVLSGLMQDQPDPALISWLNVQSRDQIWTTAITVFEIRFGLARMKPGKKREKLQSMFDILVDEEFSGRVAQVDRAAGDAAGQLAASRESSGRPNDVRDTLIAGVAISRRASIATRNLRHFADLDVPVIDPWSS